MGSYKNGNSRDDRDGERSYSQLDRIERPLYVPPHIKAAVHEAAVKALAAWNKFLADPSDQNRGDALFAEHMSTTAMQKEDKPEKKEAPAPTQPVAQA